MDRLLFQSVDEQRDSLKREFFCMTGVWIEEKRPGNAER